MNRVSRGSGFRGVLDYAFGRGTGSNRQPGRLIGGNMDGQTPRQLASEFGAVRQMRNDIEKPVWHNSLRLPVGESLMDEKWNSIAIRYMQRMGFTNAHQYCLVMHDDDEGQHIHIVGNRIGVDGNLYLGQNENLISTKIISEIEQEFGLTITKGAAYNPETGSAIRPGVKPPSKTEIEEALRTGVEPPRQQLQHIIDIAKLGQPSAPQFCERLMVAGVEVKANISPTTGKLNGFSFGIHGKAFKASDLGDNYKWANLSKEVCYEQARDSSIIQQYRQTARSGSDGFPNAAANPDATTSDDRRKRVSARSGQADKLVTTTSSYVGNADAQESHPQSTEAVSPKLIIAGGRSIGNCTVHKIPWLDFNENDQVYYFADKFGVRTPMVKEIGDGLLLVGRVAPSKCRAMLDIMQLNAWSCAVVSGGDRSFQETMLNEALKLVPLPNLRFTNTEIELKYQAYIRKAKSTPNAVFRLPHPNPQERAHNQAVR